MTFVRHLSLRNKLTLVVMATTLTALLLACGGFILHDFLATRRHVEGELMALAEVVGRNSSAALEFRDQRAAQETLAALHKRPDIEFICLLDRAGRTFASYRRDPDTALVLPFQPHLVGQEYREKHFLLTLPIRTADERVGTLYLQADLQELRGQLAEYLRISSTVLLVAFLVAVFVANRLQRVVSQPITELAETARWVTERKDYSRRASLGNQDETGLLVGAFNQMLDDIQTRETELQAINQQLEQRVADRTAELQRQLDERQRAERELQQSRRAFEELVDSLDGIVWEARADTLAITFISRQAERLLGFPIEHWTTARQSWPTCVHLEDRDRVLTLARRELIAGRDFEVEYRLLTRRGQVIWMRDIVSVVTEGERHSRLRGVLIDITSSKQAEEAIRKTQDQLRHSQKMEAIGRLAGGVAHDFNNLLTVINGYTELLSKQVRQDDGLHRLVREVQRASDRAAALTNQLLAFGRKQVLQPKPLDLNTVVAGMEKMLHRVLGENIELVTGFEPGLAHVRADPGQVEQVILNLAINSRDAMPQGGRLVIRTRNVTVTEPVEFPDGTMTPGAYVCLVIRDTGTGMDEQTQAHLFEPFFTTKGPGKGTGLGLATSYGIIKQSGGFIQVETQLNVGTEMCIYFTADPEAEETVAPAPADDSLPAGRETLLVVEDEPAVRELEVCVLRECGYEVLEAGNGAEGLRVLRDNSDRKVDLVISDCIMPQMNGKDMVDRLRHIYPATKVLFVSGYTDDMLADQGVFNSGAAFLQKPFSAQGFARKVREVLDQTTPGVN